MSMEILPREVVLLIASHLPRLRDLNALVQTSRYFYIVLIRALYRFDVDSGKGVALIWAVLHGNQSCLQWAVVARPLHSQPMAGLALNALHLAASRGQLLMVKELVASGVSLNVRRANGRTAVQNAVCYGQSAVLRWMVDNGGDLGVSWHCDRMQTALHVAATSFGDVVLADFLLQCGLHVDARDREGKTPLIRAVYHWAPKDAYDRALGVPHVPGVMDGIFSCCPLNWGRNVKLIRLLLANGADPDAEDVHFKTPRGYIQFHPSVDVRILLNELPPPRIGGMALQRRIYGER